MILALNSRVINQTLGISSDSRGGAPDMRINLVKLLNRRGIHEDRRELLLDGEDNSLIGLDSNGSGSNLTCYSQNLP